jgi:DNA invertase Pin-like site-specific DNA recombinase
VRFGAVRKLTAEQIKEIREKRKSGVLIKNLMSEFNMSKASIYRYLGEQTKESVE